VSNYYLFIVPSVSWIRLLTTNLVSNYSHNYG